MTQNDQPVPAEQVGEHEQWLRPKDVAVILQIHVDDVYELIASGEIPARKLGRRWRIVPAELAQAGRQGGRCEPVAEQRTASVEVPASRPIRRRRSPVTLPPVADYYPL